MTTRRTMSVLPFLTFVVLALVLPLGSSVGAAAGLEDAGVGIVIAIPGTVSLLAYLTATVVALGLMLGRRRQTV